MNNLAIFAVPDPDPDLEPDPEPDPEPDIIPTDVNPSIWRANTVNKDTPIITDTTRRTVFVLNAT
jgi:hypothetical protein